MFFEKNVNFVIIRVWMYTKYCLFESFEKSTVYENFVCFDLSKQIRRSTLSCKVFILFPLKIYPFTGYKQKVRLCTRNSRILTLILKRMRMDYLRRCKCDLCLNSDILSFGVSDLTVQFYLWH